MNQRTQTENEELIEKLLSGRAGQGYQGEHVVVIGGEAHILPEDDRDAAALVEELERKHPDQTPHLLFVPRSESYVV